MKKSLLFIGMFVLTLVFSSFVFSCGSSQVIFSLYSEKNSHVSSPFYSNYLVKACYDSLFSSNGNGDRTCQGKDVIFYKAFENNSHVSLTQSDVYTLPVCYGDLVCENRTNCLEGEEVLARISSLTNAHVSLGDSDSNYPIKICCKKGSPDYISSVSSAKWIDYSSGEEVRDVSNGTKVNLSFEGEFQEGELFNYRIYVRKTIFGFLPTTEEISSGSGSVKAGSFSSISFDALWDEKYLINDKTVYFFKIIGEGGEVLKESEELEVGSTNSLSPTKTKITSPEDGEIYLIGDSVDLSWEVVSGTRPVQNITYYSSGANINGTGKDSFSVVSNDPNSLLNLPLFLNYSSPGQKEIVLTTLDSSGNEWESRVLISVPREGVNIFAFINKPMDEETVSVEGLSDHLVRFNSSGSYVYNYSDNNFECVLGKCPSSTDGENPKEIISSLNENEIALKVQELYFNWIWQNDAFSIYGNGTSSSIVSFEKGCDYGGDVVFLNLNYRGVSQTVSNKYTVFYNGDYCLNNILSSDPNKCFSQVTGDCCNERYECHNTENVCKLIIDDALFCSNFTSENSCKATSPNKLPYANRSFNGMCGVAQYNGNGACYMVFEDCTCVWNSSSSKCEAVSTPKNYNCQKPNGDAEGTCNIFTTFDGSCSNSGGIVTHNNIANWVWTTINGDSDDPRKVACEKMNGTNTMACPVQVRLSFFGVIEFVVAIILIALIYFVIRDLFSKRKVSEEKIKTKKVLKNKVAKKKK